MSEWQCHLLSCPGQLKKIKTKHQSHIIYFQLTLRRRKTYQAHLIYIRKIYFQNVIFSKKSSITRHIFSIPPLRKKTSHKCSLEHQVMAATNCWTSSLNVKFTENFDVGPKSKGWIIVSICKYSLSLMCTFHLIEMAILKVNWKSSQKNKLLSSSPPTHNGISRSLYEYIVWRLEFNCTQLNTVSEHYSAEGNILAPILMWTPFFLQVSTFCTNFAPVAEFTNNIGP